MENQQPTPQQNEQTALQILAKAAEFYLAGLDELARVFVAQQVQGATQILGNVLAERHAEVAPAAEVADKAKK